jgi:hypothetical protein
MQAPHAQIEPLGDQLHIAKILVPDPETRGWPARIRAIRCAAAQTRVHSHRQVPAGRTHPECLELVKRARIESHTTANRLTLAPAVLHRASHRWRARCTRSAAASTTSDTPSTGHNQISVRTPKTMNVIITRAIAESTLATTLSIIRAHVARSSVGGSRAQT